MIQRTQSCRNVVLVLAFHMTPNERALVLNARLMLPQQQGQHDSVVPQKQTRCHQSGRVKALCSVGTEACTAGSPGLFTASLPSLQGFYKELHCRHHGLTLACCHTEEAGSMCSGLTMERRMSRCQLHSMQLQRLLLEALHNTCHTLDLAYLPLWSEV